MGTADTIKKLNGISAYQRGLFTAAQASCEGVERYTLSRLERQGVIERLAKGVYRMGGAPSVREEDVLAIWLSLNANRLLTKDLSRQNAIVATGATAAWLQQLGEIGPTPYEFCCAERKQTQRKGIIIRKRILSQEDITLIHGIPSTTASRTILDLIDGNEDLSLVANVLNDALHDGLIANEESLAKEINLRGKRIGYPPSRNLYDGMRGASEQ